MKLPEFEDVVKICLSSISIEALIFVSSCVLSHTIDSIQIVQRKTYRYYMAA